MNRPDSHSQRGESQRLSREELSALRNLQSGFYEPPVGHPAWARLESLGLVQVGAPPNPPIRLTPRGERFDVQLPKTDP
jgi:hypothetical protein